MTKEMPVWVKKEGSFRGSRESRRKSSIKGKDPWELINEFYDRGKKLYEAKDHEAALIEFQQCRTLIEDERTRRRASLEMKLLRQVSKGVPSVIPAFGSEQKRSRNPSRTSSRQSTKRMSLPPMLGGVGSGVATEDEEMRDLEIRVERQRAEDEVAGTLKVMHYRNLDHYLNSCRALIERDREMLALRSGRQSHHSEAGSVDERSIATTASADNGCINAGAVYVYVRSGSVWSFEAYIKAPNADRHDRFGSAVSISADTLAVGADSEGSCSNIIATTVAVWTSTAPSPVRCTCMCAPGLCGASRPTSKRPTPM
jgi:hypothetical protein